MQAFAAELATMGGEGGMAMTVTLRGPIWIVKDAPGTRETRPGRLGGGSEEIVSLVETMAKHIEKAPESGRHIPYRRVWVLKMRLPDGTIALRMYYWFDDEAIYLLHVEPYDELAS